ncbi:unnamed protein product [Prunus armeniaca]
MGRYKSNSNEKLKPEVGGRPSKKSNSSGPLLPGLDARPTKTGWIEGRSCPTCNPTGEDDVSAWFKFFYL